MAVKGRRSKRKTIKTVQRKHSAAAASKKEILSALA